MLPKLRLLPPTATGDAALVLSARGLRAFSDGFVSLLLPVYLLRLGFDSLAVGAIVTATLLGSAAATLGLGFIAHRFDRRHILLFAAVLMALTGAGFASLDDFWPLLIVAAVGTLNPSSGDVSLFVPLEQTILSHAVGDRHRTALFARYSFIAAVAGAIGALSAGLPDLVVPAKGPDQDLVFKGMFVLYALFGLTTWLIYRRLPPQPRTATSQAAVPLTQSRGIVLKLAALFSLDAFGGGLFVQSLLALWLFQRFDLDLATTANIFFWANLASAISFLLAVRIAGRFGLLKTMVFTHLPANICIILLPFAPSVSLAVLLILIRGLLSQMDVPTRTSYVMAIVTPPERPAAASLTAVPRSLASAGAPLLAGYLLTLSSFGWPLIVGGVLKIVYDLTLYAMFHKIKPPEEAN